MRRVQRLRGAGVSVWLDTLSRDLLETGRFEQLVRDYGVTGATSNPTIFAKAISGSDRYDGQLSGLGELNDPKELFFELALEDVRRAAELLRKVHQATAGRDGFVSFEVTPDLADDTDGTAAQALDLWRRLDLPNTMIKVPATAAGVPAIEELTALGVNVNVTLLFSVERYDQVMEAYLRGLERRAEAGEPLGSIASVASFFVSRVDTKVDRVLPEGHALRGRIAIANALVAYRRHRERFSGERWRRLQALGARPQRPLWASTGTKDPAYSDVMYVERLVTPGAVNTMPEQTLEAFADHGEAVRVMGADLREAEEELAQAAQAGIDLAAVTAELEREGVASFGDSYEELRKLLMRRAPQVAGPSPREAAPATRT